MQQITSIGDPGWSRADLLENLEAFAELYHQRPIKHNPGGMSAPHMFYTWFVLRRLRPKAVIESGALVGAGTWLIEQACPDAQLVCIDIDLSRLRYRSPRAEYLDRDFSTLNWRHLPKAETLLFFDDHQNAYERVKAAHWFGFENMLFEDNYCGHGDCYTLKEAFMGTGYRFSPSRPPSLKERLRLAIARTRAQRPYYDYVVPPNTVDAAYLRQNLAVYYEFPPVFKPESTRWGDRWDDRYPTPEPLLEKVRQPWQQVYLDGAGGYTWLCYARLASGCG